MITNDARCTREIKSRIATEKAALNKKKPLSTGKLDLHLREKKKLIKCYIWGVVLYVLKLGHFGMQTRNTCEVSKCGAGEDGEHLLDRSCEK
jgi:hypothetical protein